MDIALESKLLDYLTSFEIQKIPEDTQFWMVRTQQGYFYSEFVYQGYIALGWNIIDKKTSLGKQNVEGLKVLLEKEYRESVPGRAINKCKNFIEVMKNGDIVVIPNRGARELTFAIVGEYYEENLTVEHELEIIPKIKSNELVGGKILCPYKKRRKIEVIKTISAQMASPHLLSGISSYHGITQMNDYAKNILDCMYDVYSFGEISSLQFDVNTNDEINALDFSKLVYALTDYIGFLSSVSNLGITLNLNSPGKISISEKEEEQKEEKGKEQNEEQKAEWPQKVAEGIKNQFCEVTKKIGKTSTVWLGALFLVTGGKIGPVEAPGLVKWIRDLYTVRYDIEEEKNNIEIQELEIERQKLAIAQMKSEIIINATENGLDIQKMCQDLEIILDVSDRLKLGSFPIRTYEELAISSEQETQNEE